MDKFDLVIRNGTVVDGTGTEPRLSDVAVTSDKIIAVGQVDGAGKEEIDASGLLVTPGFVDLHTHYDGQATWSERLIPSSKHGVTTAVMGNCGVGFAPCHEQDHNELITLMEGVEDIPEAVLAEGLPWNWETFPDYLNALENRKRDIDVAAYLPHSPLRIYVMGKRALRREAATEDDVREMQRLLREAMEVGALGFATSRTRVHLNGRGEQIPSFEADRAELMAIGYTLKQCGRGVIQLVPNVEAAAIRQELLLFADVARESTRPVMVTFVQMHDDPTGWQEHLQLLDQTNAEENVFIARAGLSTRNRRDTRPQCVLESVHLLPPPMHHLPT